MGAADRYPSPALTDDERARLAVAALRDGTAARIRHLRGWTPAEMARRCNVTTYLLAAWEDGTEAPAPASAVKVWHVLVCACIGRTPAA